MSIEKNLPVPSGKNKRPCPAVNGFISTADCGAQRGSKLNCPTECPYYPFAINSYDLWLKLDENWNVKAARYVIRRIGEERFNQLIRACQPSSKPSTGEAMLAFNYALNTALFVERDAAGRTLADHWEAEGWVELNNDERVMSQHRRHSYVTVIEVQKVLDRQSALCMDVLSPNSPGCVLVDRVSTPQLIRFSRLFAWVTHYPHFSRLCGLGLIINFEIWPFWQRLVQNRLAQEQLAQPDLKTRDLLSRNFLWATDLIKQLGSEYAYRILEGLDLYQCVAIYRLKGSIPEVSAILNNKPDFEPETPRTDTGFAKPLAQFTWLRRGESAQLEPSLKPPFQHTASAQSAGTVGNVRLYQDQLIIEAFSKKKLAFIRQMVDQFFGPLVQFERESIFDLAERERRKLPRIPASLEVTAVLDQEFAKQQEHRLEMDVSREAIRPTEAPDAAGDATPPLSQPAARERLFERNYRTLLDDAIPLLDGHTPRESAHDANLRPKLVEFMKGHIHHVELGNRRNGTQFNLDWMVDALGLTELK